ncbi:MAG: hypothetical protein QNJ54_20805 [Prochloraceae cyanobacterium]|nr:hypothetical protein [Prochloraceae cyanobacterium]
MSIELFSKNTLDRISIESVAARSMEQDILDCVCLALSRFDRS